MNETAIKRSCLRYLKTLPKTYVYKASDRWISGVPDLLICSHGLWIAIELKTPAGKVSPIQDYTMRQIREAGGRTAVCRSAGEVKVFIEEILKGGKTMTVQRYEIINPSDLCYVSGEFLPVSAAVALLGNAQYGAESTEDCTNKMPIFIFGGFSEWFLDTFKISFSDYFDAHKQEIVDVLKTFEYDGERSSMNDIGKYAKRLVEKITTNMLEINRTK